MHPITRERLVSFIVSAIITFLAVWFLVSLIAKEVGA